MSWHYQIRKRTDKGEDLYDIVEVFTNPTGWTTGSSAPVGDSPEEVIKDLELMLRDAKKWPVLIQEEEP